MTESCQEVRALVVDADASLVELIAEWLNGCGVTSERDAGRFDLIIADLPFPREAAAERLRGLERAHPGTPILALSSTFFPGVDPAGAVARGLGVAAVLPKPLTREALLAAVERVCPAA